MLRGCAGLPLPVRQIGGGASITEGAVANRAVLSEQRLAGIPWLLRRNNRRDSRSQPDEIPRCARPDCMSHTSIIRALKTIGRYCAYQRNLSASWISRGSLVVPLIRPN